MREAGNLTRRSFIKTVALASTAIPFGLALSACSEKQPTQERSGDQPNEEALHAAAQTKAEESGKSMIFINSSRNKNGNTAAMGHDLLDGRDYEQIDLIDYKIYPLGQDFDGDQFEEVWSKMCAADTIVIGTPVYWHTMAGSLKLLIDRMYDKRDNKLAGKRLAFFAQGGGSTQMSLENLTYTFERVAANYGMELVGTSTSAAEIPVLKNAL